MAKIAVSGTLVEGLGDEMSTVFWPWIRDRLILRFVDLPLESYDLSLTNREKTKGAVTEDFIAALMRHRVAVRAPAIRANRVRQAQFGLSELWEHPTSVLHRRLPGAEIRRLVRPSEHSCSAITEKQPVTMAWPGLAGLQPPEEQIPDEAIRDFLGVCFDYALENNLNLCCLVTSIPVSVRSERYAEIYAEELQTRRGKFSQARLQCELILPGEAIENFTSGNMLALLDTDGGFWSNVLSRYLGSPGLMPSMSCSPCGCWKFGTVHGTLSRHFRKHQQGEPPLLNPTAAILSWSSALRRRGIYDRDPKLVEFADHLESAVFGAIANSVLTSDLLPTHADFVGRPAETEVFIDVVGQTLEEFRAL
jgi:isocitrate dehydrogenase